MFWGVAMSPREYGRLILAVKRQRDMYKHRKFLDELLLLYHELTPSQRKRLVLDTGYRDPEMISYLRDKDREALLQSLRDAIGSKK